MVGIRPLFLSSFFVISDLSALVSLLHSFLLFVTPSSDIPVCLFQSFTSLRKGHFQVSWSKKTCCSGQGSKIYSERILAIRYLKQLKNCDFFFVCVSLFLWPKLMGYPIKSIICSHCSSYYRCGQTTFIIVNFKRQPKDLVMYKNADSSLEAS